MKKFILVFLLLALAFTQDNGDVVVVSNDELDEEQVAAPGSYEIINNVYNLNEKTFRQAIQEFDYVLVKFFAPWCGHCQTMAPAYKEVGKALADVNSPVKIAEVDCTQNQAVCQQKGIRGYPTVLFFTKGQDANEKYPGSRTKEAIISWLSEKTGGQKTGDL